MTDLAVELYGVHVGRQLTLAPMRPRRVLLGARACAAYSQGL